MSRVEVASYEQFKCEEFFQNHAIISNNNIKVHLATQNQVVEFFISDLAHPYFVLIAKDL